MKGGNNTIGRQWLNKKPTNVSSNEPENSDVGTAPINSSDAISGYMSKQGEKGLVKSWKKRWFKFYKSDGKLQYFLSENDTKCLGMVDISQCTIERASNKREFSILLFSTGRIYYLMTASDAHTAIWVGGLSEWKTSKPLMQRRSQSEWSLLKDEQKTQLKLDKQARMSIVPKSSASPISGSPTPASRQSILATNGYTPALLTEIAKKITEAPDIAAVSLIINNSTPGFTYFDMEFVSQQIHRQIDHLRGCISEIAKFNSSQIVTSPEEAKTDEALSEDGGDVADLSDFIMVESKIVVADFSILPSNLVYYVFSFLLPAQLAKSAQVCSAWKKYADNPLLWSSFFKHAGSQYDLTRDWKATWISKHLSKTQTQQKNIKRVVTMYGSPAAFGTVKEGWLSKKGEDLLGMWKKRWFIINGNCLFYFKTPKDGFPCGCIPLTNLNIAIQKVGGRRWCFQVTGVGGLKSARAVHGQGLTDSNRVACDLSADSEAEMNQWIAEIRKNMNYTPGAVIATNQDLNQIMEATIAANKLERTHPIFGVPLEELMDQQRQTGETAKIPLWLKSVFSTLTETALDEEGLMRLSGSLSEINQIREELEAGLDVDFKKTDTHALTGLVKSFFRELPHKLISNDLNVYAQTVSAMDQQASGGKDTLHERLSEFRFIFQSLPPDNYHVLRALVLFMVDVDRHSERNKMNENNLMRVITPTLGCFPQLIIYGMRYHAYLFSEEENPPLPTLPTATA